MTGSFIVSGSNTTVRFEYTATTVKISNILNAAAHYLFDNKFGTDINNPPPVPFASLTNQQKLNLLDDHLKRVIMDLAKSYNANNAADTARDAAIVDADTNLTLP